MDQTMTCIGNNTGSSWYIYCGCFISCVIIILVLLRLLRNHGHEFQPFPVGREHYNESMHMTISEGMKSCCESGQMSRIELEGLKANYPSCGLTMGDTEPHFMRGTLFFASCCFLGFVFYSIHKIRQKACFRLGISMQRPWEFYFTNKNRRD